MKKIRGILVFSILCLVLSPGFASSQEHEGWWPKRVKTPAAPAGVNRSDTRLAAVCDREGGCMRLCPTDCETPGKECCEGKGVCTERTPSVRLASAGKDGEALEAETLPDTISDPLEPINRVFFHFNDKLYFWVLKPVSKGYKAVTPEEFRVCVKNFFYNLAFPVRFVNCVLQGKIKGAGNEIVRFIANSTAGFGGLVDVATNNMKIKRYEEDLGQTFGSYGIGSGFYINWPILGPSSLRDTFGKAGDAFLDPVNYVVPHTEYRASVKSYETVNKTSLAIGEYEDLKKAALDPYVALRDAYYQNRKSKIKE